MNMRQYYGKGHGTAVGCRGGGWDAGKAWERAGGRAGG